MYDRIRRHFPQDLSNLLGRVSSDVMILDLIVFIKWKGNKTLHTNVV